ncbi:tight adherence pilus pseudopilin TadF [Vibrio palustris]|uniref:TadE-like protein n=1 Tax=Vibrio palustris TaxID=1918946 RepID=A0A1R4B1K4_9VIBR|nr:tight adherence pilus pseudopilin TadF [Vibrio palustris]SJL82798.1 hypothetical protein VPAL9027_00738 [Vibrio palustris]
MTLKSTNQSGNFTIEFAIVGIFFGLLLVFSADLIIKINMKGTLERLSYSMASVVKERTQLFNTNSKNDSANYKLTSDQAIDAYSITVNSLKRTLGSFNENKFGFDIQVFQRSDYGLGNIIPLDHWNSFDEKKIGIACNGGEPKKDLIFQTSWGRSATLYQVTLCYDTMNWFGGLVGKDFSRVSVRSISVGR